MNKELNELKSRRREQLFDSHGIPIADRPADSAVKKSWNATKKYIEFGTVAKGFDPVKVDLDYFFEIDPSTTELIGGMLARKAVWATQPNQAGKLADQGAPDSFTGVMRRLVAMSPSYRSEDLYGATLAATKRVLGGAAPATAAQGAVTLLAACTKCRDEMMSVKDGRLNVENLYEAAMQDEAKKHKTSWLDYVEDCALYGLERRETVGNDEAGLLHCTKESAQLLIESPVGGRIANMLQGWTHGNKSQLAMEFVRLGRADMLEQMYNKEEFKDLADNPYVFKDLMTDMPNKDKITVIDIVAKNSVDTADLDVE